MDKKGTCLPAIVVGLLFWFFFLIFQMQGIYAGDCGDLVTAAYLGGVPHPPGYPLYTMFGFILSRLPFLTVSWRVAILSSLPHAISVSLLYSLLVRLFNKWRKKVPKRGKNSFFWESLIFIHLPSIFVIILLTGSYLFFLYSVTAEVFALFDLFVFILIFLAFLYIETGNSKYIYLLSFFMGLSLTHHHVILFLVPALIYCVFLKRYAIKKLFSSYIRVTKVIAAFITGLLPYLYIPIAARGTAIINWDRPTTITNFIRLVTRAGYGTFVSSPMFEDRLLLRLHAIRAYGIFFIHDYSWVGALFIFLGFFFLWKRYKHLFYFLFLAWFFLGPFFFFYASFPLVSQFSLGTYERFLLPSYMVCMIIIGAGVFGLLQNIESLSDRYIRSINARVLSGLFLCILMIYPASTMGITAWRFRGLPADRTTESLGVDILESVEKDSILLLQFDTPLFISQYVRYVLKVREDVAVIHGNRLLSQDYRELIKEIFPQINIPEIVKGQLYYESFIKENIERFPIYSNAKLNVGQDFVWYLNGLVYKAEYKNKAQTIKERYKSLVSLWNTYNHPEKGILLRNNHLMLSDIANVYAFAREEFGIELLNAEMYEEARDEFVEGLVYDGDRANAPLYIDLGVSEYRLGNCEQALSSFEKAVNEKKTIKKAVLPLQALVYRDCIKDEKRAEELSNEFEALVKKDELRLE